MRESIKVSIIVPVYNLINNLSYCVNSISNQTYENIEIILVDDGSSDGSSELCNDLAGKDDRIKVIHKVNAGVSVARNTGLNAATGKYIMFVDGDDIISPNAITVLLEDMHKTDDCILSGFGYRYIDSYNHRFPDSLEAIKAYKSDEVIKGLMSGFYIYISSCCKLYNRDLIGDLRFIEGKGANEDKFFVFQYLMKNQGIVSQRPDELYGYYVREGSACNSPYSKRGLDVVYFSRRIVKEINEQKPELIVQAEYNDSITHLSVLKSIIRSHKYRSEHDDFYRVKMNLLKLYSDKPLSFFGRYKYEIMALKLSDYLYILCVYLFDMIK